MNITKNIGMLLLGIYLILVGLTVLVPALSGMGLIMAVLALVAGICIIIGK